MVEQGEWATALEGLKRAGKIRYYGVVCDTVEAGLAALRYPGISIQFTLNLLEQRAGEVTYIARECLANGLLVKQAGHLDRQEPLSASA